MYSVGLGVADGWVVILSCLSDSIIHELMDERVNELKQSQAQAQSADTASRRQTLVQMSSRYLPLQVLTLVKI